MSELSKKPQPSPDAGTQQSAPGNSEEAFRRAGSLLTIENEDSGERGRQALVAIEHREAADRPSDLTDDADALARHMTDQRDDDDEVEPAAAAEVEDALDEKAREGGVEAANDTAQIVWDLTPHNL